MRGVNGDDFAIWDDPKRTFSLPNDTAGLRVMLRCERADECRTPDRGELVQPHESFDFKLYLDEDRTYVVADAQGKTLGCVTVPVASGVGPYPVTFAPDTVSAGHPENVMSDIHGDALAGAIGDG
jgi:hypothetical protein